MSSNSKDLKRGQGGITVLALFILALVFSAPRVANAAAGSHSVGIGLGQVLLMGDFSKNFSDGLGLKLTYGYEASDMFGLLASFGFSSHSNADASNTLLIKGFQPDLKVNFAYIDKLVLYGFTGFGIYRVNEALARNAGAVWTLGFELGTGFLLNLDNHFSFGSALGFNNIFGKTDSATVNASAPNGITIGGTFLSITLNGVYTF